MIKKYLKRMLGVRINQIDVTPKKSNNEMSNECCGISQRLATLPTPIGSKEDLKEFATNTVEINNSGATCELNSPSTDVALVESNLECRIELLGIYRKYFGLEDLDIDEVNSIDFDRFISSYVFLASYDAWDDCLKNVLAGFRNIENCEVEIEKELLNLGRSTLATDSNKIKAINGPFSKVFKNSSKNSSTICNTQMAKLVPFDLFLAVYVYLVVHSKSEYALLAANMILATVTTGVRPNEWLATEIINYLDPEISGSQQIVLKVGNSKILRKQGIDPIERELDITYFEELTMSATEFMIVKSKLFNLGVDKMNKLL